MKKFLLFTFLFCLSAGSCLAVLTVSLSHVNDICNQSIGSVTANASGGTPPYTYVWSNLATTASLQNIPSGTYTVTVTDNVSSTASATVFVANSNTSIQFLLDMGAGCMYSCHNACNGMVSIPYQTIIGGTPPFSFTSNVGNVHLNTDCSYSPNLNYAIVDGVCGNVIVTITDALGCTGQESVNMFSTPVVNPIFYVSPSCDSMANGSVTVSNIAHWGAITCDRGVNITPDTTSWLLCDLSPYYINSSQTSFTAGNLFPGSYYFGIKFDQTDTTCPSAGCQWGCPQYFPFTIPDIGPTCSNVQGNVFVDWNINCVNDAGDVSVPNTIIEFTPGPYYAYTDNSGHYSTNLLWGNYNMVQYPPAYLTQLCPANPFPISMSSTNTTDTVNFADTSNVPFDVAAHLSHGTAHPGFNFNYGVSVQNLSYTASGILTVTLNYDPLLSFVSANPVPFSTSAGQVVWQLNSITNFQSAGAWVTLSVPPNPALIGDTLNASVIVSAVTPEANLTNNSANTWHIITGSFDPNIKTVESPAASFIPAADGWFNYTIQFQNTGNDTALNIEVIDSLDADLDVVTFVPGAASHAYTTNITGQGVLHFMFSNIMLPDSGTDEPNSHGFISFRIRCKQNRTHGTTVNNKSDIVFDFNPPVATNTTTNTVDLTLAINSTSTTICAGQSVTLTMIPELLNTPWRWRTGTCTGTLVGNGNSITVSPTVTTTYFVRDSAGTIPVGACYRKTIIVNTLPVANITAGGPTTFCAGNSVTLNSTAGSSYLWSNGATTQSIVVANSGNYVVTVTSTAGCTASSSTVAVTVNLLPTASITPSGPTTFCQGGNVMLAAGGANNYLWSNSATSQSINVTSSGNYFVTVTDANNCSTSASLSVMVNPLPTASITPSGPTTFCVGDSVTLTSSVSNSYLWSTNATSQSITVNSSGSYTVTVTDANNCSSASPVTTVTVNSNPPVPNIIQVLDSLVSDLANGYQWYFNNVLIPGATSHAYHPTQNGNYSVVITDMNGCTASSTSYPYFPTSINNVTTGDDILIYPNPAGDELIIENGQLIIENVEVWDMVGRRCLTKVFTERVGVRLDVSSLVEGIYFVKVASGGEIAVRKFVKE